MGTHLSWRHYIFRLEAHVKGKPMPKVQWLVNGLEIKPSPKYSITWEGDRSVLLIKNITKDDTAIYAIRAVNDLGEAVSSTTLYVIRKYRKSSCKIRAKFQDLYVSCLVLQLSLPNPLKPGIKLRMKM